jgi:hypothetical protein
MAWRRPCETFRKPIRNGIHRRRYRPDSILRDGCELVWEKERRARRPFPSIRNIPLLLLPSFATLSQFINGNVFVPFTKDNRLLLFIDNLGFGLRRLDQQICAADANCRGWRPDRVRAFVSIARDLPGAFGPE